MICLLLQRVSTLKNLCMVFQKILYMEHILLLLILRFPLRNHDSIPILRCMLHLNSCKKEDAEPKDQEEQIPPSILVYFQLE